MVNPELTALRQSAEVLQYRLASQTSSQQMELHLQPASLLVLKGDARHMWTHAIPARKTDVFEGQKHTRYRRISLTFRTMKFENT
jgi:alkylated DNA repair dioxygenase AlkB